MTDNEILQALECCQKDRLNPRCRKCPLSQYADCQIRLEREILPLVNRQRAEIEDLKDKNEHLAVLLMEAKAEAIKETVEKVADKVNRVRVEIPFPANELITKEEVEEWGNIIVKLLSTAVNNALKEVEGEDK